MINIIQAMQSIKLNSINLADCIRLYLIICFVTNWLVSSLAKWTRPY